MSDKPYFDRIDLHPKAAEAVNADGIALLGATEVQPLKPQIRPVFETRREPAQSLTDADLVGEPLVAMTDWTGQTLARYFVDSGTEFWLRGGGYVQLRRLVDKVLKTRPFSNGLSRAFIEDEIFKWWRARVRGTVEGTLCADLLDAGERSVIGHSILVPLAGLEIERPFLFGDIRVTPLDAKMFNRLAAQMTTKFPDQAKIAEDYATKMRQKMGHLAAVNVSVTGEPNFAQQQAREVAFDMASMFRFMSPAGLSWNVTFNCFPQGSDHIPCTTEIMLKGEDITSISTGSLHPGQFNWKASSSEIDQLMKAGFQNCAVFFQKKTALTGFQQRVKRAIASYSQGIASYEVSNRLIYAISTAEHLLLRDSSEPIQANVGDRMAFVTAGDARERQAVAANFKKAYAMRSKQIHHLVDVDVDDEEVLEKFFRNMWILLLQAVKLMPRIKEHAEFIDEIDQVKFA